MPKSGRWGKNDAYDGWEHTVVIEKIEPGKPGMAYPFLLAAAGRCPPEDVGGPSGYAEYLEAMADPNHERHAAMLEWRGSAFDPAKINIADLDLALDDLATKWSRPRKPKAK